MAATDKEARPRRLGTEGGGTGGSQRRWLLAKDPTASNRRREGRRTRGEGRARLAGGGAATLAAVSDSTVAVRKEDPK